MSISYGRVLVTGANSFYAAAIIDRLVKLGIKVHGAVRRESAINPLKRRYGDWIRVFLTPNLEGPDAFMDAVQGCDAIFHIASPFRPNFKDSKAEVLDPAINGTLAALKAAAMTASVKRVVMTSSVAAIINPMHELAFIARASKALAERAAWNFMEQVPRHFDLITVNPCQTWGCYGQDINSTDAVNLSNSDLSKLIDGKETSVPESQMPWVTDINAVADAHVRALLKPEARGRYLIATSLLDFQEVVDILHSNFHQAEWINNAPKGQPGVHQPRACFVLDNMKSKRELRVKYTPIESTVIEFCKQYQKHRKVLAKM